MRQKSPQELTDEAYQELVLFLEDHKMAVPTESIMTTLSYLISTISVLQKVSVPEAITTFDNLALQWASVAAIGMIENQDLKVKVAKQSELKESDSDSLTTNYNYSRVSKGKLN